MKTTKIILILILSLYQLSLFGQEKGKVLFFSEDSIEITGDIYFTSDESAPLILLFHQANFSRGEYIEIAPKLNKLGFNCLAIDQRSGNAANKIKNQTHINAKNKGLSTKYPDAYPDLQASINFVADNNYNPRKIIIWGSSYSASLAFVLAAKNKNISGVLAFSPGEYFTFEDKTIAEWAKGVTCPVFVSSSYKEAEECKLIFMNAYNEKNVQFAPKSKGSHGSKALWESKDGHKVYWKEVKKFLNSIK